jgi:hypothetical protein
MKKLWFCGLACLLVIACGAAQSEDQAKGAAIFAGCKYGLEAVRDAGEAGAINAAETGCEAELKAWREAK